VDSAEVTGTSFTVKEAGTHAVTMTPKEGYGWADGSIGAKTLTVNIEKATYDTSKVKWCETTEFTEDGTLHSVTLTGLPEGVTAIYSNNSASVAGSYTATVNFLYDTVNYSAPNLTDKTCNWTIKPETKDPATPDEANKPVEPDEPTEPVAATTSDGKLNGGALAAVIVVSVLAGIAIIALVVVLIEKSRKPQIIYDGGFYDNVDEDDK